MSREVLIVAGDGSVGDKDMISSTNQTTALLTSVGLLLVASLVVKPRKSRVEPKNA